MCRLFEKNASFDLVPFCYNGAGYALTDQLVLTKGDQFSPRC